MPRLPSLLARLSLLLMLASPARAHSTIDGIEHIFGATNVNAVTGHGRLSVGVSADGDLSVLSWPNPSVADQIAYLTSNAIDARDLPRLGAPEGAGVFLGLAVEAVGGTHQVVWLRDRTQWSIAQDYGDDDGPNIVTRHSSEALGLVVTVTDAVAPPDGDTDVLVRSVTVERLAGSSVVGAWLLTYANLSLTPPNSKIAELPVVDWLLDGSNDYAAVWDAASSAIIHFHPNDQLVYRQPTDLLFPPRVAFGAAGDLLRASTPTPEELAALVAGLDDLYSPGTYAVLTTQPPPDQHQLGFDATPLCAARDTIADNILELAENFPDADLPLSPEVVNVFRCADAPPVREREGWTHTAEDALADIADGELSGSGIAAGEVNEALRTPLAFPRGGGPGVARAAVVLGFGADAGSARAAVSGAVPAAVVTASSDALATWLEPLRLPESVSADVRAVARRSLINLRVGTDAATGAAVASISRQPPYHVDWPRDGAFFNVALDISGQSELVTRRSDLYLSWQRSRPAPPVPLVDQTPPRDPTTGTTLTYPADSWEMNYFPDGTPGGPIRFEIDNTALALWSIVAHAGWVPDPAEYLRQRWSAIARAARLLARWVDAASGLQAPASEDDSTAYTQQLQGATTVYGALEIAARAARLLGEDTQAERWEQRACELRGAIETLLYDDVAMRFVNEAGETFTPATAPTGRTAWLVWPNRVFPWDDARVEQQLRGDLELIQPHIGMQTEGGSYFMKNTVTLGLTLGTDPETRADVVELRDLLATRHATPGTRHFGEVMLVRGAAEERVASQRVANPHLWEGILFYLTAMALASPERFDLHDGVLPMTRVPPPGTRCIASAACAGDCNHDAAVTVDELITGVTAALGAAPLSSCPAFDAGYDGIVTVDEIVLAVDRALSGCPDLWPALRSPAADVSASFLWPVPRVAAACQVRRAAS